MAAKKTRAGIEWVGGIGAMPAYVVDEGERYRPDVLIWLGSQGAILGSTTAKPGETLGLATESLRDTIERPIFGRAHAPTRVRVASLALADALRAGHPSIEFVCAPTPELDEVFASMEEAMKRASEAEQSYLSPEVGPDAVASFFRAAAVLFRANPWKRVPSDESLFSVGIETLGLRDAVLLVIGQMGESFGVLLFSGIEDFEVYLDAADAIEHGEQASMPPLFALNFERGADLSATLRKEIAQHRWEVAGADAYPWLMTTDAGMLRRPPTARDVTISEAISLALPQLLIEKKALLAAWEGGESVSRTFAVRTHAGELEVMLRAPYERERAQYKPPYHVLADLFELARDGEDVDPAERAPLEDELMGKFAASPEGKTLKDPQSCRLVMDFAADYFGATIATLGASELRDLFFEIIPRKLSMAPSGARELIEDNRAFYSFLKREYALEQANACLRVIGEGAVKKLEAALSEPSNFGLAKSLLMAGCDEGFDMDTQEGVEAWMRSTEGKPLPASVRLPSFGEPARAKKKQQRKAARKTRKKNR